MGLPARQWWKYTWTALGGPQSSPTTAATPKDLGVGGGVDADEGPHVDSDPTRVDM